MVDADTPEPLSNKDLKGLAKTMLASEGGITGIVVAGAPTVVFFVANALSSLRPALIAAITTAVLALGWQLIRRRPLRQAIVGLVVAAVSASVAAFRPGQGILPDRNPGRRRNLHGAVPHGVYR